MENQKFLFICYARCSTCRKARKWLDDRSVNYTERAIDKNPPTKDELKRWILLSSVPLKRFFNTSGQAYKSGNLKDKITSLSENEQINLLSSDGMLVKRPLLIGKDFVLVGFKEDEWAEKIY